MTLVTSTSAEYCYRLTLQELFEFVEDLSEATIELKEANKGNGK
ncbi:MAG: hypothetical protein E6590_11755 [Clostridiales bacterium]|nr:hypothetical protein [Clostridiales bacterium]